MLLVGDSSLASERNDVLFLGDSACQHDVDPALFERSTGLRAYNLGLFASAGPAVFAPITELYLAHHPRPKLIVLCVSPLCLSYDAALEPCSIPWRFLNAYGDGAPRPTVWESLDYFRYFARRGLADRFPIQRDNLPLIGEPQSTLASARTTFVANRGHATLPGEHTSAGGLQGFWGRPPICREDWNVHTEAFLKVCKEGGVPVMLCLAPLRNNMREVFDLSAVEVWFKLFGARHPDMKGSPSLVFYDPELHWDSNHLNSRGAERFTKKLGEECRSLVTHVTE